MRRALPNPWASQADWSRAVTLAMWAMFTVAAASALLAPQRFWLPLALAAAVLTTFLAARHTLGFCLVWLLAAGVTLEMTLNDLVGSQAFYVTIAVVKAFQLALALLCVARYGPYLDALNPSLAFLVMFVAGLGHGLHPSLPVADSLRSLLGSVAPFAFGFSRLSRRWARTMIRATIFIPILSVSAGAALDLAGMRAIFYESGGERLAGLGHPAFLANVCLTAIYASLVELYRDGQLRWLLMLGTNFVVLVLTGARAPLAYGVAVTGITLAFVRSPAFPPRWRILPLLLAACLLPLLLVLASELSAVRLFNMLGSQAGNLSGRELLWPPFEQSAASSPWFGWGLGAGNAVIPPDSELAQLIQTRAPHNEYLRILVEGGRFGFGLLIGSFILWVWQHTRRLVRTEKVIIRLAFLAFAAHCYTDNVLISTTACVFFTFVTAVFARGRLLHAGEVA